MQGLGIPGGRVPRGTSASSRASAARAFGTDAKTASTAGPSRARRAARGVVPGSQAKSLSRPANPAEGATRGSTASGACARGDPGSDSHGWEPLCSLLEALQKVGQGVAAESGCATVFSPPAAPGEGVTGESTASGTLAERNTTLQSSAR